MTLPNIWAYVLDLVLFWTKLFRNAVNLPPPQTTTQSPPPIKTRHFHLLITTSSYFFSFLLLLLHAPSTNNPLWAVTYALQTVLLMGRAETMGHSAQYFTDDFVICHMSKGLCGKAGRGGHRIAELIKIRSIIK